MLAAACSCPAARVFADEPWTCHRCGRDVEAEVTPSTWRLALAIAEIALGQRRLSDNRGSYERNQGAE